MRISHGYRKADRERLHELNDQCFTGLEKPPRWTFDQMIETSEVWVARAFVDSHGDPTFHTTGDLPTILGCIIVNREHGPYLWSVAVDPAYRGRGVAGNLMREAELWVKFHGGTEMRLHVKNDNPSQKLYYDRGYRVIDLAQEYYGPETLALVMRKTL